MYVYTLTIVQSEVSVFQRNLSIKLHNTFTTLKIRKAVIFQEKLRIFCNNSKYLLHVLNRREKQFLIVYANITTKMAAGKIDWGKYAADQEKLASQVNAHFCFRHNLCLIDSDAFIIINKNIHNNFQTKHI